MEDYRDGLEKEINEISMTREQIMDQLRSLRESQFDYYAGMNTRDRETDDIIKFDVKALDYVLLVMQLGVDNIGKE